MVKSSNPVTPLFDLHDVKDEIKKWKLKKSQLDEDKHFLNEEIEKANAKLSGLRHELNILKPIDEVRLFQDEGSGVGNTLFDIDTRNGGSRNAKDIRNFQLNCNTMNAKLEMQIINEEIRAVLPKLEAEVALWENSAKDSKKSASKSGKSHDQLVSNLIKPVAEIEQLIGEQLDVRFQLKAQIAKDLEMKKHAKNQVVQEVAGLRRSISQLLDAKESLTNSAPEYLAELLCEEERVLLLTQEHHHFRSELSRRSYHGGQFWQTDAFLTIAGAKNAKTIEIQRISPVLCRWLYPELDENDNNVLSLDIILEVANKIRDSQAHDQDDEDEDEERNLELTPTSTIDFRLFLQLCSTVESSLRTDTD